MSALDPCPRSSIMDRMLLVDPSIKAFRCSFRWLKEYAAELLRDQDSIEAYFTRPHYEWRLCFMGRPLVLDDCLGSTALRCVGVVEP